jgi:hypothetical protein
MSIFPSLQTKLEFLENVVILSFGDPSPFTSGIRNEWIRTRTQTFFPTLSEAVVDELMLLSNTINTLGEGNERIQFLLQQGDLILFHSFSFSLLFIEINFYFIFSATSTR